MNQFHHEHLNPYVNSQGPCAVPTVLTAANSKPHRIYQRWELNERLWDWLDTYPGTEHSSLGTTPLLRWQRDIEYVRQLSPSLFFIAWYGATARSSCRTFLIWGDLVKLSR